MKAVLLITLGLMYVKFRGSILELVSSRQEKSRYGYCERLKRSINQLDLAFLVNSAGIITNMKPYSLMILNVLMYFAFKARREQLARRIDYEIRRALIHLLFETYYSVSSGNRFDQLTGKLDGNLIIDEMFCVDGSLDYKLLKVGQQVDSKRFNRLVSLIKQMEIYDSCMILDELDQLIEMTLKDDFEERKNSADKMGELFIFPMALNLINMTCMIVVPFIREWYF